MTSFLLRFYFFIPILLVVVAGALIRKRGNPDKSSHRYFLFLVWTSLVAWSLFTYTNWGISAGSLGSLYNTMLAPLLIGVSTLTMVNLREWQGLSGRHKSVVLLFIFAIILAQLWFAGTRADEMRIESFFLEAAMLMSSVLLWLAWTTGNDYPNALGLAAVLYLFLFNVLEGGALPFFEYGVDNWLAVTSIGLYLLLPGLVIPAVAILTLKFLQPIASSSGERLLGVRIGQFILIFSLVVSFLYTIAWLCIWDGTDDGIRGLIMILLTIIISSTTGMIIALSSGGWWRWSGFALAIVISYGVFWVVGGPGKLFRPYDQTEKRAVSLQSAIEDFKATHGKYPAALGNLVPLELWRIPRPMIVRGEEWCYDAGPDYYRLGTLYREHWSSPEMTVRVYASTGNVPDGSWSCDERLAKWQALK
jgi:hypothetical protein